MTDKLTLTSSWADEVEENDHAPVAKPAGNAWSRGNPYGITVNAADAQKKDQYSNDFPSFDEKRGNERSAAPSRREEHPREQGHARDGDRSQGGYQQRERDNYSGGERRGYDRGDRGEGGRDRPQYGDRGGDGGRDRPQYGGDRGDRGDRPHYGDRDNRDRGYGGGDRGDRGDRPYGGGDRGDRQSFGGDRGGDRGERGFGFGGDRGGDRRRTDRPPREPREPVPFPTNPPFTAFIGNLDWNANQDDVQKFFETNEGPEIKVISIRLLEQRETGRSKGFGYVEFQDLESLKLAVAKSGEFILERPVKIDVAEAKPEERKDTNNKWGSNRDRPRFGGDDRGDRESGDSRERERDQEDSVPKERKPLDLKKRTVDAPAESPSTTSASTTAVAAAAAPSDAYAKAKVNPFGAARPRDENAILKKKEEERKTRTSHEEEPAEPQQQQEQQSPSPTTEASKNNNTAAAAAAPRSGGSWGAHKEGGAGRGGDRPSFRGGDRQEGANRGDRGVGAPRGRGGDFKSFGRGERRGDSDNNNSHRGGSGRGGPRREGDRDHPRGARGGGSFAAGGGEARPPRGPKSGVNDEKKDEAASNADKNIFAALEEEEL